MKTQSSLLIDFRKACAIFAGLVCLLFSAPVALAFEVQEIVSAKGIKAWLVEAHDIPILSMMFSMPGGRNFEAAGKEGAHAVMADMLGEGAGPLSSEQFKAVKIRLSSRLSFFTDADFTAGYLGTLSKNRDATANLLQVALTSPHFENAPFERLRDQALQSVAQGKLDQTTIAGDAWFAAAFPGHLYGRNGQGTPSSLKSLTTDDLRKLWNATANRRDLRVAVVGDITPAELRELLDRTFGDLPDYASTIATLPVVMAKGPIEIRVDNDGPQTAVNFGNPSLVGDDHARWASRVLAEILGGQASFARLTQALRETSGLTYSVGFSDYSLRHAAVQVGAFSTARATAEQALQVLKSELARFAKAGPTAEELRKVKTFMNGSYALRFADSDSIASELLSVMQRGYDIHYFKDREVKINAVSLEDIKTAAAKLLVPENQIIVIVGKSKL
jgi:zinc protease